MTEHTALPWTILDGVNVLAGDRMVANTGGHQSNVYSTRLENIANARLIAAAPDLLANLRTIKAVNAGNGPLKYEIINDLCNTAIAKATE